MNKDLALALTLRLQDRLVGPLRRAISDASRDLKTIERDATGTAAASKRASEAMSALGRSGRDALAAADGLRKTGDEATRTANRVIDLKRAMSGLANVGRGVTMAFGAGMAAKAVFANPLERAQQYELSLARLSNVAYNDRKTVAGRQEGQRELDGAIRQASAQGVTREAALSALNTVIASGVDRESAKTMLTPLAQFSVAGDADINDVANIAIKAMKTYGIAPEKIGEVLEKALVAGQEGNFEFKDMAKWLPNMMAMSAGMLGMSGQKDFATLLAASQMASNTAGNSAEAGNNLVNFLGKINSADTAADFKKQGIDLSGTLAAARDKGVDPVNAFLNLVEQQMAKDKRYTALQSKLDKARSSGYKEGEAETLRAMSGILAGSAIGRVVQDRQALMGMLGILQDRQGFNELRKTIETRTGEAALSQQTILATSASKNLIADNAEAARQYDGLSGLNSVIADTRLGMAKLSEQYPGAAAGLEVLTLSAMAASAALAVMSLGNLASKLLGGGAAAVGGAAAAKAAGSVGLFAAGGVAPAAAAATGTTAAGLAIGAGGVLLAGGAGVGVGTLINKGLNATDSGHAIGNGIGEGIARLLAILGNEDARAAVESTRQAEAAAALERAATRLAEPAPVRVYLDGRELESSMSERAAYSAYRE